MNKPSIINFTTPTPLTMGNAFKKAVEIFNENTSEMKFVSMCCLEAKVYDNKSVAWQFAFFKQSITYNSKLNQLEVEVIK